jgi:hypothetical protein
MPRRTHAGRFASVGRGSTLTLPTEVEFGSLGDYSSGAGTPVRVDSSGAGTPVRVDSSGAGTPVRVD